jgi:hypothetical protein
MALWKYLSAAGAAVLCGVLLLTWVSSATMVYAETKLQSAFFRGYDPGPLFATFRKGCGGGFSTSTSASAGAGERSFRSLRNVRFSRSIQPDLCNQREPADVLSAIHSELRAALESAQCRIAQNPPSPSDQGMRISYSCGERSSGVVSVAPPERTTGGNGTRLKLALRIDEQWSVAGQ